MGNRRKKGIGSIVLAASLLVSALTFGGAGNTALAATKEQTHGTSEVEITEDMLVNTPPKTYKVDGKMQADAKDGEYNQFFLKDKVQTISIEIDENNLNYMFQNAKDKPTVMTKSVTIGDKTIGYAGLKTKGSYTLSHSVTDNPGSDRFSLTINFGKYIKKKDYGKKQNFYGVNKISLNNFFFDKTMMKEFAAWTLLEKMGLPTPQYGLAKLYINGEYYGVYFMVEALDSSIMEQYYHCDSKDISDYLCKPEGTKFHYEELMEDDSPLWEEDEDTYKKVEEMLPTVKDWVKKLNQLSQGKDFENQPIDVNSDEYLTLLDEIYDVDEVVRYFAAHSFLCQNDNMFVGQKNFGLYVDEAGKALLLPWDYDLAFGCYAPSDSESTANYNIDLMYTINMGMAEPNEGNIKKHYEDFPLFYVIFQNDSLREKYHTYMKDCAKIMALGGTTSFGEAFKPGLLADMIDEITPSLLEAAEEEVTKNAAYMNHGKQPRDARSGIPHLKKIIALRSVGVLNQVDDMGSYVSGFGCSLATLGNGMESWWNADWGIITAADADTGMYITADYEGRKPVLQVEELPAEDEEYLTTKELVNCQESDEVRVFTFKEMAKAISDYDLTIPLDQTLFEEENPPVIYEVQDGKVNELTYTYDENRYTVTLKMPKKIMVIQSGTRKAEGKNGAGVPYGPILGMAGVLALFILVELVRRSYIKKKAFFK